MICFKAFSFCRFFIPTFLSKFRTNDIKRAANQVRTQNKTNSRPSRRKTAPSKPKAPEKESFYIRRTTARSHPVIIFAEFPFPAIDPKPDARRKRQTVGGQHTIKNTGIADPKLPRIAVGAKFHVNHINFRRSGNIIKPFFAVNQTHVQKFHPFVGKQRLQTLVNILQADRVGFFPAAMHEQYAPGLCRFVKQPFDAAVVFLFYSRKFFRRIRTGKVVNKNDPTRHAESIMPVSFFFFSLPESAAATPENPENDFPENRQTTPASLRPTSRTAAFLREGEHDANDSRSRRNIPKEQ